MSALSDKEIKSHVRTYIKVFIALAFLTVVTVLISYLDLPLALAIIAALLIATFKGSLVACFFMHLISEKKIIYSILIMTLIFFIFLMIVPSISKI